MLQNERWGEFYSKRANLRDILADILFHLSLFIEIIKIYPRNILEIGIGRGSMSIILSLLGLKVLGIDNNEYLVSLANKRVKKIHLNNRVSFMSGDAFKLGEILDKSGFDCCFSQGFFEHFADEEIRLLVSEQLKVANVIVFSVPSNFYPFRDFGDERLLSLEEWKSILKNFNVTLIKYYGHLHSFYVGFKKIILNQKFDFSYFKPLNILIKIEH